MVDHSLLPWRLRSNTELGRVTRWIEDASGSTVCELPTTYTAYLEEDARIEADGKTIVLAVNARLGSTVDTAIASAPPLCG